MAILLRFKSWMIFMIIILGLLIGNITVENQPSISIFLRIIGITVYIIYPLLIGHFLQNYLPRRIELSYNFFLVNTFLWFTTYSLIIILSGGQGMTFTGLIVLPLLYIFFAFFHFFAFPAKTLKSIELKREARLSEYLGEFILMLILPIGIWALQPRVNKIIESKKR